MRTAFLLVLTLLVHPVYGDEIFTNGITNQGHIIQDEGDNLLQYPYLNFIGDAVVATNDSVTGKTKVTITAGAGSVTGVTASNPVVSSGGTAPNISLGIVSASLGGHGFSGVTDDALILANGTIWQPKILGDCDDSGGNHLNYDTATNTFSCGTSGDGVGSASANAYPIPNSVQFEHNGALRGDLGFTYNATSDSLTVGTLNPAVVLQASKGGTGIGGATDDSIGVGNGTLFASTILPNVTVGRKFDYSTTTNAFTTSEISSQLPVLTPTQGAHGFTGVTDDTVIVANGTLWQSKGIGDCDDSAGNHLNYDTSTNVFSCGSTDNVFQTTSNVANLRTSTDNLTIGSSTNLAKVGIDGDTDEVQLLVQGHSTQSNNLFVLEKSDGTDVVTADSTSMKITGYLTVSSSNAGPSTITHGLTVNSDGVSSGTGDYFRVLGTTDIGWSVVDQTDNQACNTGCTAGCVFGIENATGTAVTNIVSCAATTADLCLCAGAS